MTKSMGVFLWMVFASFQLCAQQQYGRELFNARWQFHLGDLPGAFAPRFNDASWRTVDVPHDYSIEGDFNSNLPSCNSYLPGGIGWYRKSFVVPAAQAGKKVVIQFDGVYKNSEVWINGHYLGKRPSGYVAFEYELTPWIRIGQQNVIAVKVDHEDLTDSGWYTGSGIYRNVFLCYRSPVHIKSGGLFVQTPEVSYSKALVNTTVELQNETVINSRVTVTTSLLDANGKTMATTRQDIQLPGKSTKIITPALSITAPQLWSVDTPYLYTLRTTVSSNGKITDQQEVRTGIRQLRFNAQQGFFLNGKNTKLKGVCMVHDAGVLGSAVPRGVWESRLRTLKAMGCNAIRACHNPHATEFLDVCDEQGFLVIAEAFDEWAYPKTKWIDGWNQTKKVKNGYAKYFPQWGTTDLHDQVLRDRNHPSIIMWSIGNEIDFPNDPYSHPSLDSFANPQTFARYLPANPDATGLKELAQKLATVVRALDTTRPVTSGLASAYMSTEVGYAGVLDVSGYNYQENLYAQNHQKYPGQILYGSETGHRFEYWKAVTDNDFVMGQFLWTGFEYLGESFKWPQRHNPFGIIDLGASLKQKLTSARAYGVKSPWPGSAPGIPRWWNRRNIISGIITMRCHIGTGPHRKVSASVDLRIVPPWNCC